MNDLAPGSNPPSVPAGSQSFLIYQKPSVQAPSEVSAASTLSEGRWQIQMGHLVNLFEGQPGTAPSGPQATTAAPVIAPTGVPQASAAQAVAPSSSVQPVPGRHGQVLTANTFLKADQYQGIHHTSLQTVEHQPKIDGAPNYREIGDNIHGCGQPTVAGMKEVLRQAGAAPPPDAGKPPAVWTNLRQEAVIYINGTPYNPRDVKKPMDNEAAPGRTADQVDQREQQLKQDVLSEAKANGGYITLHDEVGDYPNNHIVEKKVQVDEGSVHTVKETYDELAKEGYNVKYQRIPIADTKKPEDKDVDAMVQSLKDADPKSPLIFNCHAGEGRTTTAMVEASLVRRAKNGDSQPAIRDKAVREDIKEQGDHDPANYRAILQGVKDSQRLLGTQEDADGVIAKYSDVHDLKSSVKSERAQAEDARKTPEQRAEAKQHAADYLDRYHTILSVDRYVQEQGPDYKKSFEQWKHDNPEVEGNLEKAQVALNSAPTDNSSQTAFA